jgi:protoporphyrinogen oxidase
MSDSVSILIVGAGPTGLGAAWRLNELKHPNWLLCEAEETAGGLAGSVLDEYGFTWDLGGHVQFSHFDYFDELMDDLLGSGGWLDHERQSWVWIRGGFVPYPFQLNLHRLPVAEREECVEGLQRRAPDASNERPQHFGGWIDRSFGPGIARIFLRPYNFKVWAYEPEDLAWDWVGDRVAEVDVERVRENIRLGRDDVSWGPNNRFRFPVQGGTGAIWRMLASRVERANPGRLKMGQRLVRLDTAGRLAHFEGGYSVRYDWLLSTAPLDVLVRISDLARTLEPILGNLKHSSTHIIGVGLYGQPGDNLAGKCWIYFPEADCPFYRATVFSHYSPNNVPDIRCYWSLMAEVSESPNKPVDAGCVVEDTVQGMINTRLISDRAAIHHVWHRRLEYGYPTPSLRRDETLQVIRPLLEARGVFSRGRFGGWKYEVANQDHSFAQGVESVDHWLTGAPEVTLNHPEIVNARRIVVRSAKAPSA